MPKGKDMNKEADIVEETAVDNEVTDSSEEIVAVNAAEDISNETTAVNAAAVEQITDSNISHSTLPPKEDKRYGSKDRSSGALLLSCRRRGRRRRSGRN